MKRIKNILIIILMLSISSCEKFLDETPTGSLTPETDVTSPEIARAFANSGYSQLTTLDEGSGGYGGNTAELMEFMTGKAEGNAQSEAFKFYNLEYDAGRPARAPVKEIYDEIIIPDLLTAETSTLPSQDNSGRVSMSAVKSLLADVYLTYASYPVQGGEQYYAESAKRSKEVI